MFHALFIILLQIGFSYIFLVLSTVPEVIFLFENILIKSNEHQAPFDASKLQLKRPLSLICLWQLKSFAFMARTVRSVVFWESIGGLGCDCFSGSPPQTYHPRIEREEGRIGKGAFELTGARQMSGGGADLIRRHPSKMWKGGSVEGWGGYLPVCFVFPSATLLFRIRSVEKFRRKLLVEWTMGVCLPCSG